MDRESGFFEILEFGDQDSLTQDRASDNIFSILEALQEYVSEFNPVPLVVEESAGITSKFDGDQRGSCEAAEVCKRQKVTATSAKQQEKGKTSISVERNKRKQMNQHLSILRSLMPSFYVKRADQASIIGGVVDYINELQQILQSLEAKKQRRSFNEVSFLSPRNNFVSGPRPSPLSPRKPPLSPKLSPTTPQPKFHHHQQTNPSTNSSSINNDSICNVLLVANSRSAIADVEVKFSGPNILLKTVSPRIPGQPVKMISVLEGLSLEILHVTINTVDETMLKYSFTIKIGIECQLSAEELAQQIQYTFC